MCLGQFLQFHRWQGRRLPCPLLVFGFHWPQKLRARHYCEQGIITPPEKISRGESTSEKPRGQLPGEGGMRATHLPECSPSPVVLQALRCVPKQEESICQLRLGVLTGWGSPVGVPAARVRYHRRQPTSQGNATFVSEDSAWHGAGSRQLTVCVWIRPQPQRFWA